MALRAGDVDGARDHVTLGMQLAAAAGNRWVEAHLRRVAASVALVAGETAAAAEEAAAARAICRDLGLADVEPTVVALEAAAAGAAGDVETATRLIDEAVAMLEPSTEQAYLVWYEAWRIAELGGDREAADEAIGAAAALVETVVATLDPPDRDRALSDVPEHRAILVERDRRFPRTATVSVPSASRGQGRPLREDEWVDVRWTVHLPDDLEVTDPVERRRLQVLRLIAEADAQGAAARAIDLAAALDVGQATIKRDLAMLRESGALSPLG